MVKMFAGLISGIVLLAALGSSALPVIEVKVPPVVHERWSVMSIAKPIPKMFQKKESKLDFAKLDFDFFDVLAKILPKNEKSGERQRVSLTFVLGALVPVALVLSYLLALAALVFNFLPLMGFLFALCARFAMFTSAYALVGTHYLGKAAQSAAQASVDQRAEGLLGLVTQHLVRKITIQPDTGLFVLFGCLAVVFMLSFFKK